jgi:transposase
MDQPAAPDRTAWPFPLPHQDWEQTPPAVQASRLAVQHDLAQLRDLQSRVEVLEARLKQDSTPSHRPPSSDHPYTKPHRRSTSTPPRKAGGKPGHVGHRQVLLPPTAVHELHPARCACGHTTFGMTTPDQTHPGLELPHIEMEVTHWVLYQGCGLGCGTWSKAPLPPEPATGYGPRCSALIGELAGTYGNGRRMVQTLCASVLRVPLSLGAIQQVLDRVTQASAPHYDAMALHARRAPVNSLDATSWFLTNTLPWLWVMASATVAFSRIHPHRSKEACAALSDAWEGLLVSDGDGVYQSWVQARHTCVAHLIRTARGLAARPQPDLAACGAWALTELQRLCHMATAPPTGGAWRAWYARRCALIDRYPDRQDDAGRCARRLLREMDALWVFLAQQGVEPTNNRAERALRFGVIWRKRSQGTASVKGHRWVARILSLKETCRLQARSTYTVLVEAVSSLFAGRQPALAWIGPK